MGRSYSSVNMDKSSRRRVVLDGILRLLGSKVQYVRLEGAPIVGTLDGIYGDGGQALLIINDLSHPYDEGATCTLDIVCWCEYVGPAEMYMVDSGRMTADPHAAWRCPKCGVNHSPADYKER